MLFLRENMLPIETAILLEKDNLKTSSQNLSSHIDEKDAPEQNLLLRKDDREQSHWYHTTSASLAAEHTPLQPHSTYPLTL
jgi:hypothetical protein